MLNYFTGATYAVIGLLYLIIFFKLMNYKKFLFFSIFCFFGIVLVYYKGGLKPILLPWENFFLRISTAGFISGISITLALLLEVKDIKKNIARAVFLYFAFLLILLLVTLKFESKIFIYALVVSHAIFLVYFASFLLHHIIKNKPKQRIVAVGLILLGLFAVFNILAEAFFDSFHNIATINYKLTHILIVFLVAIGLLSDFFEGFKALEESNLNLEHLVQDRTKELSVAKRTIEETNQAMENFIINNNHESFNNQMIAQNLVLMSKEYGQMLVEEDLVKDSGKDIAGQLQQFIYSLETVIQQQLDDSMNINDIDKKQRGESIYDHDTIKNICSELKIKLHPFSVYAKNKGLSFNYTLPENDIYIKMNGVAFDRILRNLIINAIKFTHPGGSINIDLQENNTGILLSVSDTGIGIESDQIDNIFKPYFQIKQEKITQLQGIGQGLSTVKMILDEIGAKIVCKSVPGKGTTFTVIFNNYTLDEDDIVDEPVELDKPVEIKIADPKDRISGKKYNILVVEDNVMMSSMLIYKLGQLANVYFAENGKTALERLKGIPKPNLIVSDVMMDEMDGFEFVEALNQDSKFKNIPLIFLTAKTGEEFQTRGLELGAIGFIKKPYRIDFLKYIVNNNLKKVEAIEHAHDIEIPDTFNLTDQEKRIVGMLIAGLKDKEICQVLNISVNTIKTHNRNIYRKTDVRNRTELKKLITSKKV